MLGADHLDTAPAVWIMKSTLAIYDAMLEAKVPAAAARGVAEALERDMEAIVATKTDLQNLRAQVSSEIHALKVEMDSRFAAVDRRFDAMDDRFERLELRLTVKLGAFLAIAVGLIVTLQQLLR
jgi:uncharacterized protein YlxW (UPF0749 family)